MRQVTPIAPAPTDEIDTIVPRTPPAITVSTLICFGVSTPKWSA